jgi:oligopeptidase B
MAKQIDHVHTEHGIQRPDPFFWLRERDHPDVLAYLQAENDYLEGQMKPLNELRETLFQEMKGRLAPRDNSVPYLKSGFWYYHRFEEGLEHARTTFARCQCRRAQPTVHSRGWTLR